MTITLIYILIATIYILTAFYTDIRWMRIPNILTGSTTILGITIHSADNQWEGFFISIIGWSTMFLITFLLYLVGAIGNGDVKGFAALGALMGLQFSIYVLSFSLVYAAVAGLYIITIKNRRLLSQLWVSIVCFLNTKDKNHLFHIKLNAVHTFPFMLAVLPAYLTSLTMVI